MANLVIIEYDELEKVFMDALEKFENIKNRDKGEKLLTVNQVAKRLGKANATIKKAVTLGLIRTTIDGLISEKNLNEYLQKS